MQIRPTRKVAAGGVAGSITLIMVWAVGYLGVVVPPEVASAVTVVLSAAAAWIVRETRT